MVALSASACGLLPWGPRDQTEWQPEGTAEACRVDDEVPAYTYVRRVKGLLTGEVPTNDEIEAVTADPTALRELVEQWSQTPAFESKLSEFFELALQLNLERTSLASQVTNDDRGLVMHPELERNLRESFVRTAVAIVKEGRPFTDVAATRTWKMTTAMMSFLVEADHMPAVEDYPIEFYRTSYTRDGMTFDENTPISVQIDNLTFYAPGLGRSTDDDRADDALTDCNAQPYIVDYDRDEARTWLELNHLLRGGESRYQCDPLPEVFVAEDFSDWRDVTMVTLDEGVQPESFDAPTLRDSNVLPLRSSRTGFVGAPSWLASWETNEDNDFRVTTSQALVVGLGLVFEGLDDTIPLGDEGLSEEHAGPDTDCYGCHKNLDPMRNYFKNEFRQPKMQAIEPEEREALRASFSFQGYTGPKNVTDEDLRDFGVHLAAHPYFATGWAQKLCHYANAEVCSESDPDFQRIVADFEQSWDFQALLVDLFSSPLVTNATCAAEREPNAPSIARRDPFCDALAARLGVADVCTNNRSSARTLAEALPATAWSRGKVSPERPISPSLMYAATTESLCSAIANNVVDRGSPLESNNLEGSLDLLVTDVMGLPSADPRHTPARAILQGVVDDVAKTGRNSRTQLQEAFVVACSSPFLTSTDL